MRSLFSWTTQFIQTNDIEIDCVGLHKKTIENPLKSFNRHDALLYCCMCISLRVENRRECQLKNAYIILTYCKIDQPLLFRYVFEAFKKSIARAQMCWRWFNAQVPIGAVAFTISFEIREKQNGSVDYLHSPCNVVSIDIFVMIRNSIYTFWLTFLLLSWAMYK